MIRFCSLGSGSSGNALLVESGQTLLLLDCGFSAREALRRMTEVGVSPDRLNGILVTHEHTDHVGGVFRLARKLTVPVWLTAGTLKACSALAVGADCHVIDCHAPFTVADFELFPLPVPHDAREPVQYVFSDGRVRLGVLTDAGEITPHMCEQFSGCQAMVLECNHDNELLACSRYPRSLKQRIAGRFGHLENQAAASLLRQIDCSRLQHVVAAHLSEENNRPQLAAAALADALGCEAGCIGVASAEGGFSWRQIS